jgi:hypothetical protein
MSFLTRTWPTETVPLDVLSNAGSFELMNLNMIHVRLLLCPVDSNVLCNTLSPPGYRVLELRLLLRRNEQTEAAHVHMWCTAAMRFMQRRAVSTSHTPARTFCGIALNYVKMLAALGSGLGCERFNRLERRCYMHERIVRDDQCKAHAAAARSKPCDKRTHALTSRQNSQTSRFS